MSDIHQITGGQFSFNYFDKSNESFCIACDIRLADVCSTSRRIYNGKLDIGYTYDGVALVSDRGKNVLSSICDSQICFSPFCKGLWRLNPCQLLTLDEQKSIQNIEGKRCAHCNRYPVQVGSFVIKIENDNSRSEFGLYKSNLFYGSCPMQRQLILCEAKLTEELNNANIVFGHREQDVFND